MHFTQADQVELEITFGFTLSALILRKFYFKPTRFFKFLLDFHFNFTSNQLYFDFKMKLRMINLGKNTPNMSCGSHINENFS
jgi:hypothetical protein